MSSEIGPAASATSSYASASSSYSVSSQGINSSIDIVETTPPAYTLDIQSQGGVPAVDSPSPSSPQAPVQRRTGGTYYPGTFADRFRYDIENGFRNPMSPRNFSAVTPGSSAAATYSSRGQARSLVWGGGLSGVQGAIFSLRYENGNPEGSRGGIANREAINQFRRISQQNLPLLSMFG